MKINFRVIFFFSHKFKIRVKLLKRILKERLHGETLPSIVRAKEELDAFLASMGGQSELFRVLYGKEENVYYFQVRTKNEICERQWQDFFEGHDKIREIDYTARF